MSRRKKSLPAPTAAPGLPDPAPSLPPERTALPRAAAALLVAAVAAVTAGVALAFPFGGIHAGSAAAALLLGLAAGVAAFVTSPIAAPGHPPSASPRPPLSLASLLVIGAFALASYRAFFWLLYAKNNEYWVLSPNNLGDLALHITLIRYLASGVPFWPESPILVGEPLKYPLGADLLNGLLLAVGVPLEPGLVWVGALGAAVTGFALWRWGRAFALAAFLFGGGLGGFLWLRGAVSSAWSFWQSVDTEGEWLARLQIALTSGHFEPVDVQSEVAWKNLFLALFVTQRGLLLALPAGLLLLDHWRARAFRSAPTLLPTWAAWLLYATMPLINVHAFLFLSVALAFIFLFAPGWRPRRDCLAFVLAAVVPATACAWLVTGGFAAGGGIHWFPGWLQHEEKAGPPVLFWLNNFGLYLVLAAALVGLAAVRRDREQLAFAVPAALVFVACALWSFAVWPWDNTKLLLWCWLAVAPGIWAALIQPLPLAGRALACFVLFFTGALSLVAGLDQRHGYTMGNLGLTQRTQGAVRALPRDATFAAAPEYNHPLLLAGRRIAVGYDGHLWSHGLDYQTKTQMLTRLMRGAPDWQKVARELGVDFLYWGPQERLRYPESRRPWAAEWTVVAQGPEFTIYAAPNR